MSITRAAASLRASDLTQVELAQKLEVTQQAISAWCRGLASPGAQRRASIEALTGIPAADWDIAADVDSG